MKKAKLITRSGALKMGFPAGEGTRLHLAPLGDGVTGGRLLRDAEGLWPCDGRKLYVEQDGPALRAGAGGSDRDEEAAPPAAKTRTRKPRRKGTDKAKVHKAPLGTDDNADARSDVTSISAVSDTYL